MPTIEEINKILVAIRTRAERLDMDQIVSTFVNVGPMMDILNTDDHQIVYGRRGTGKTHALRYLSDKVKEKNDVIAYIDMTNLGSDISIYNNNSLPTEERATRLLIDVLRFLNDQFVNEAIDRNDRLSIFTTLIDNFGEALSQVRIAGDTEQEDQTDFDSNVSSDSKANLGLSTSGLNLDIGLQDSNRSQLKTRSTTKTSGRKHYTVRFSSISSTLREIVEFFGSRVWIIFDEWSSIPEEIQPFLADLLRRAFFNIPQITVKIAAIEHRSSFKIDQSGGQYIGFELTADIRANLNLDNYLVFDNDRERAIEFFSDFLFRHVVAMAIERGIEQPTSAASLTSMAFTQRNVLEEFVKSTEGVPRDAIHIISIAAQKAFGNSISMQHIRQSAHRFYQEDKIGSVDTNRNLAILLRWIVDSVIKKKRTSAFLLEFGEKDDNIDALFDRRMIHIKARNMSSRDNPGVRYYHYKLDYGCYIDLISTSNMPIEQTFFDDQIIEDELVGSIEVPEDDARSYRRAILDLNEFYKAH